MSDLEVFAIEAATRITVSELHGSVTGVIAAAPEAAPEEVVERSLELLGADVDEEFLAPFVEATMERLFDPELAFAPLLEDDNDPLGARVRSLREWVNGFLTAYGVAAGETRPAENIQETLQDFMRIAEVDDELEDSDDAESDFVAIYEFVRVGALLIVEG